MNPTLRSAGLTCLKLLNEAEYEAWWVGGCVRDTLLSRPVQDVDVTTSALPEQTIVCFRNAGHPVIPTGLKHGTVTVMIQDIPCQFYGLNYFDVACASAYISAETSSDFDFIRMPVFF